MHLRKGDIIDVISPATPATKAEMRKISQFLAKNGLKARFLMENELLLDKKPAHLFPLSLAEIRFNQLKMALQSDSQAIWCARGGYGSADLMPFLQINGGIKQTKMIIGFSDITALSGFLVQNWNYKTIYGPMLTQLAFKKLTKNTEKTIFEVIFGKKTTLKYEISPLNNFARQKISGTLVGGCLSVLIQSIGTVNQINWGDKILFLEDIDETGEKLDRYFTQILQICKFHNSYPKAILLGNFSENIKDKAKKANIFHAIANFRQKIDEIGIEIALFEEKSGRLGHAKNMAPLLIGGEVEIDEKYLQVNLV